MSKKIVSLVLIISLCLSFCACGKNEGQSQETEQYVLPTEVIKADVSLPYTSADTFDPYTAQSSMNRDLIPVIYESLYTPTNNGKGEPVLAQSGKVDGKVVTVKLKSGVKFSDGVAVTAAYVKVAFEKAKTNDYYKDSLSQIVSATVVDSSTIKFTFSSYEPFAFNVLSFPLFRSSNGKVIGSGKYKVQYIEDNVYLQVNGYHRDYKATWNKQIALYDMAGVSGPVYSFKTNDICVYKNDLSGGSYVNLSSKTISQDINNFVYVGMNSGWAGSITSIPWVRQAINVGIDRTRIASSSFLGQTQATVTPYRMEYTELNYEDLPSLKGSIEKAVTILERNGYDSFNDDGVRTNGSSSLKLSILVCNQNPYKVAVAQALKSSLEDLGFGVTIIEKKTTEDFEQALKEGFFNLYIGEVIMPHNYGMKSFFSEGGAASYGISTDFFAEYSSYESGTINTMAFIERFETEVPFVPLFYRKAVISVSDNIIGVDEKNPYSSITNWVMQEE